MSFYKTVSADNALKRQIAELALELRAIDFRFGSDLDLYTNAAFKIGNNQKWRIYGPVLLCHPFYVTTELLPCNSQGRIKIQIFNELRHASDISCTHDLIEQYESKISSFITESRKEMESGQIYAYFAAVLTEHSGGQSISYYPEGPEIDYYLQAEMNVGGPRAFHIVGEMQLK